MFSYGLDKTPKGVVVWADVDADMAPFETTMFSEFICRELIEQAGVRSHDRPTIRRIDLATDVAFREAIDAQAALDALSAMTVPRLKMRVIYGAGSRRIESIAWFVQRGIRLRVYDRSAKDGRGEAREPAVLRFEHQHRPRTERRTTLAELPRDDLPRLATAPLVGPAGGQLLVGNLSALHARLVALRESGAVSDQVAERLLGTLVRFAIAGPDAWPRSRTATFRARELRNLGLAYHPQLETPVDLGPILRAVQDAWAV